MSLAFAKELDLQTQKTDIEAWKIDGSLLKIFKIVIIDF